MKIVWVQDQDVLPTNSSFFFGQHFLLDIYVKQEGFLQCQTPTSTIRLKDEGGRMGREGMGRNERWRVKEGGLMMKGNV